MSTCSEPGMESAAPSEDYRYLTGKHDVYLVLWQEEEKRYVTAPISSSLSVLPQIVQSTQNNLSRTKSNMCASRCLFPRNGPRCWTWIILSISTCFHTLLTIRKWNSKELIFYTFKNKFIQLSLKTSLVRLLSLGTKMGIFTWLVNPYLSFKELWYAIIYFISYAAILSIET